MKNATPNDVPDNYASIVSKSEEINFTMPSDLLMGSLLKTLMASKPDGNFLELGTGTGLALSWMVDGMTTNASITSIDNNPEFVSIAQNYFASDNRVNVICIDGSSWLQSYAGKPFDLVFADAWPGKYSELDVAISHLKIGGFYVIDDMIHQPNWPEGHDLKVEELIARLESRNDLKITKLNWSTGVILAVRIS